MASCAPHIPSVTFSRRQENYRRGQKGLDGEWLAVASCGFPLPERKETQLLAVLHAVESNALLDWVEALSDGVLGQESCNAPSLHLLGEMVRFSEDYAKSSTGYLVPKVLPCALQTRRSLEYVVESQLEAVPSICA